MGSGNDALLDFCFIRTVEHFFYINLSLMVALRRVLQLYLGVRDENDVLLFKAMCEPELAVLFFKYSASISSMARSEGRSCWATWPLTAGGFR